MPNEQRIHVGVCTLFGDFIVITSILIYTRYFLIAYQSVNNKMIDFQILLGVCFYNLFKNIIDTCIHVSLYGKTITITEYLDYINNNKYNFICLLCRLCMLFNLIADIIFCICSIRLSFIFSPISNDSSYGQLSYFGQMYSLIGWIILNFILIVLILKIVEKITKKSNNGIRKIIQYTPLRHFINNSDDICPICLENIVNCVELHCGHKMCEECLSALENDKTKINMKCPTCYQYIYDNQKNIKNYHLDPLALQV